MPGCNRRVVLILALAGLAGCGGSDDSGAGSAPTKTVQTAERGVLDTIDALQTASRKGDGHAICQKVFTRKLAHSIRASAKRSCAAEVRERLFVPEQSIAVERGIRVTGITASAVIREQNNNLSTLHLLKRAGRWRIDRVTPQNAGS